MIPILQERMIGDAKLLIDLQQGDHICCDHLVPHSHDHGGKHQRMRLRRVEGEQGRLISKELWDVLHSERSTSVALSGGKEHRELDQRMPLLKPASISSKKHPRHRSRSKETHRSTEQRRSKRLRARDLPEEVQGFHLASDFNGFMSAIETLRTSPEPISLSSMQLADLLTSTLNCVPSRYSPGVTLASLESDGTLLVFTGYRNATDIRQYFVRPLEELYQRLQDKRRCPVSSIPLEDRVVWFFIRMYHSISWGRLLLLTQTKMAKDNFRNLVIKTANDLSEAVGDQIAWPSLNLLRSESKIENSLCFVIDATSLPILKPSTHQISRAMWVQYKKHYAFRYTVITLLSGRIVYTSDIYDGSTNDDKAFNTVLGLRKILGERYSAASLPSAEKFALGGDKGYVFCAPPTGWKLLITQSGVLEVSHGSVQTEAPTTGDPAASSSADFERVFSKDWAGPRATVERAIGRIKRFDSLSIARHRFNDDQVFLRSNVIIGAVVANLTLDGKISFSSK